mgnify:CR=1 FL=1
MPIISSDTLEIGDVFNSRVPYIIPRHQRTYSWGADEIDDYCSDLKKVMASPDRNYFFGGIVCIDKPVTGTSTGRHMIVIDGQQRLSTFMLTITSIREAYMFFEQKASKAKNVPAEQMAKIRREDIENRLMFYWDRVSKPPIKKDRLALSLIDEVYFSTLINTMIPQIPTERSHRLIKQAYKTIHKELIDDITKTKPIEDGLDKLQEFQSIFLDRCLITQIVCDTEDEAFLLFEVLNDRGRELATCDHLRNYTLQKTSEFPDIQQNIATCWDVIAESESAEKFLKAVVHTFLSQRPGRILHQTIRDSIIRAPENVTLQDAQGIAALILKIKNSLGTYERIMKGDWPYLPSSSNSWVKSVFELIIRRLKHVLCVPLLLKVYECKDEAFFADLIRIMSRAVPRYINVCAQRPVKLEVTYNKIIESLNKNPTSVTINSIKNDIGNLISSETPDAVLYEKFDKLNYGKDDDLIRYLLLMTEYYRQWVDGGADGTPVADETIVLNLMDIHLEHIYPQSPKPANVDAQLEPVKNQIGNITIMRSSDNRGAANDDFYTKKTFYGRSSIGLTRELENITTWDLLNYNNRLDRYKNIAKNVLKA